MKILVATPYYAPMVGGLENYARQLGLAMRDNDDSQIVVVTSNHEDRRTVIDTVDGMTIYRLGTWFKLSNTPINPLWSFMIRGIIRREQPDVVHAHTPVPSMADAAALAAGKLPFILTYHAATLKKAGSPVFNMIATVYGLYERLTLGRANRILAVSEFVKDQLPARYQSKTVVIPNAVPESAIIERPQTKTPDFLFIGSLDRTHAWKGLDLIIEAIALCNAGETKVTLTVMGDGNNRAHYEELASRLGQTEYVKFAGITTGAAKDKLLSGSMALVAYPTSGNDAFPTVFLEAWAKSLPVVAAAIGPIPSLIENGTNGYLVEPNDPTKLAVTLMTIAANPTDRQRVASESLALVARYFTWERQAKAMAKLLEKLS